MLGPKKLSICALALMGLPVVACVGACGPDKEAENVITAPHPFTLSEPKTRDLVARLNNLALGETESQVVALLGTPNQRGRLAPKFPRDAPVRWVVLTYVVRKEDWHLAKDSDNLVDLWFDDSGKLVSIAPKNLPDVRERP